MSRPRMSRLDAVMWLGFESCLKAGQEGASPEPQEPDFKGERDILTDSG